MLGPLRLELANRLGLIDEEAGVAVGDRLPDVRVGRGDAALRRQAPPVHAAVGRVGRPLRRRIPRNAIAHAYDLIGNGNELGGGSFRIHEADLQARAFDAAQPTPEQQREKFGFLLDALAMGAPPHGGIAFGIDRMAMVLAGEPNLRDVIAFPKNQAGVDPMSGAPTPYAGREHLRELGIRLLGSHQPTRERYSLRARPLAPNRAHM